MPKKPLPKPKTLKSGLNTVLLVIDVQNELFEKSHPIYQAEHLLALLCQLIERARLAGIPVIFIQHSAKTYLVIDSPGWQIHPRLIVDPADRIIHKTHGNAFEDTPLEAVLDGLGVGQVIVTGLVSHGCVAATAEGGLSLGYRVRVVQDAHSNYHKDAAQKIVEVNQHLAQAGCEVLPASEIEFI